MAEITSSGGLYARIKTKTDRVNQALEANISRILPVAFFALIAFWGFSLLLRGSEVADPIELIVMNIGPELAGIVIGVVTIDYLNERRQNEQLKEQLLLQLTSKHPDVVDTAFKRLQALRWFHDGSLIGAKLVLSQLQGADLQEANLEWANLMGANLMGADLQEADLRGADLRVANLQGAALWRADLWGADLRMADLEKAFPAGANLQEANLEWANLMGANLMGANLQEANLQEANLEWANLRGAHLESANLAGADLRHADLLGAKGLKLEQLAEAAFLEDAIMPDGTELISEEYMGEPLPDIDIDAPDEWLMSGLTFKEWAEAANLSEEGFVLTVEEE